MGRGRRLPRRAREMLRPLPVAVPRERGPRFIPVEAAGGKLLFQMPEAARGERYVLREDWRGQMWWERQDGG